MLQASGMFGVEGTNDANGNEQASLLAALGRAG
jgi:hypothetical protein